jgi:hypothetical protein
MNSRLLQWTVWMLVASAFCGPSTARAQQQSRSIRLGSVHVQGEEGTIKLAVTDRSLWPGEIKVCDAAPREPNTPGRLQLRTVYRRPETPRDERGQPVPRLGSLTQGPDGIYFCSGLDGLIFRLQNGVEKAVYDHDGQIRHVEYDDAPGKLLFSVVPTPQNHAPLADGAIHMLDLPTKRIVSTIRIAQRDVGRDWWGQFAVSGKDIHVATRSTIYRLNFGLDRDPMPVEVWRAQNRIHTIAFLPGVSLIAPNLGADRSLHYVAENGGLYCVERDFKREVIRPSLAVTNPGDLTWIRMPNLPGRPRATPSPASSMSISGRILGDKTLRFGTVAVYRFGDLKTPVATRQIHVHGDGGYRFSGLGPGRYVVIFSEGKGDSAVNRFIQPSKHHVTLKDTDATGKDFHVHSAPF